MNLMERGQSGPKLATQRATAPRREPATRAEKCRRAADHAADPTSRACSRGPQLSDHLSDRRLRHVTVGYVGYVPNLELRGR